METSNTTSFSVCFNPNCKQTMDQPKKGWRLRSGGFTELCDRCGSAYEEGKFCETFHLNASGWRCCETCGKQIHCGCIVSFNMFVLLDAGGIACLTCARKRSILRIKDLSRKNWSPIAGSGPVPWRQAPRIFSGCIKSQEAKASFEFDAPSCADILHFEGQNNEDSVGQLLSGEKTCSPNILENRFSFARYLPCTTDQELLQICGENHIITPLFEKTLSASDAGPMGRLILPKKCVEVYLPSISRPEGLPLEVRDYKGNEWLFQLRFWLNNNSRMYVLEGVTPFIQSLELQAGDIVTFSRIEPGGKLIMGSRKASSTTLMDQGNEAVTTMGGISENGMNSKRCPKRTNKSIKRTGRDSTSISKPEEQIDTDFFNFTKGKNCILACKSTSLMIDNGYMIELKLNSKEAQGLIRPPPGNGPKVIVIEGFEIEEYEDVPIIGKQSFKKMKVSRLDPDSVKTSKELDGLANLAILEGGASLHATTRNLLVMAPNTNNRVSVLYVSQ